MRGDAGLMARALSLALREGALESAEALAERVAARFDELPSACKPKAQEEVLEALLMLGQRERAVRWSVEHAAALRSSAKGCSMLEVLGTGVDAVTLPDGRPNFLGLSRQIEAGQLDAQALAQLFERSSRQWVRAPELHLLFFMALRREAPSRALTWLNRFLNWQGLPPLRSSSTDRGASNWLSELDSGVFRRSTGPLVSVIVPVRNAEATLAYALRSLLRQSYQALEILVCDDGSRDASPEIIREMGKRDGRIRAFRSSANQGAYNVRNALALRAQGELVTFHDADDFALPGRIAEQVECIRRTRTAACVGSLLRVTAAGAFTFFRDQKATRLCPVSLMLSREVLQELGRFRAVRIGADRELYVDLLQRYGPRAVARIRAPLVLGLWSSSSATRGAGTEALEDGFRAPVRRAYSELVYAKYRATKPVTEAEIVARLDALANLMVPTDIEELT